MPLPQLNLDDLTYAQLVEEAQALIPSLAPEWTNHNPSDPGIMLIELLAWLTEMVIYRVNQVPDESIWKFLELLNGGESLPGSTDALRDLPIEQAIATTIAFLRRPYRAVTGEDYAFLVAKEWPRTAEAGALGDEAQIARIHVVERHNPEAANGRPRERADHISLILLPMARYTLQLKPEVGSNSPIETGTYPTLLKKADSSPGPDTISIRAKWSPPETPLRFELVGSGQPALEDPLGYRHPPVRWDVAVKDLASDVDWSVRVTKQVEAPLTGEIEIALLPPQPSTKLRRELWNWLNRRRLLTVRHHIVGPVYVPLAIEAVVHLEPDAAMERVRAQAQAALRERFDPLRGGQDKQGWLFGRHIYLSEVNEVLVAIPGIEYVRKLALRSNGVEVVSEDGKPDKDTLITIDPFALVHLQAVHTYSDSEYAALSAAEQSAR